MDFIALQYHKCSNATLCSCLDFAGNESAKSLPHGTTVWLREEAAVKGRLGNQAVIAGVQLYADATVVNLKGTSVHPVYMCLLNHSYEKKIQAIETVAYLPALSTEHSENCTPDQARLLKLQLYHTSFDILLRPLRQMSNGMHLKGPDERTRLVVPVILNFIGDNPEVCEDFLESVPSLPYYCWKRYLETHNLVRRRQPGTF